MSYKLTRTHIAFVRWWVLVACLMCGTTCGRAQHDAEIAVGLNVYFPDYRFSDETGSQMGLLFERKAGLSPCLDGLYLYSHHKRWQAGLGFRFMALPTGNEYWISTNFVIYNYKPDYYLYAGIPVVLRYRINYLFSVEAGWQSLHFLNKRQVSPLYSHALNDNYFAWTGAFQYHLGRVRLIFRVMDSFAPFSQIYTFDFGGRIIKSELRHRNFQIMLAWTWQKEN